jgi:putative transposase
MAASRLGNNHIRASAQKDKFCRFSDLLSSCSNSLNPGLDFRKPAGYTIVHTMRKRSTQLSFLAKEKSAYGGELQKKRRGRLRGRPLGTRATMHLVLRSSQAQGACSFRHEGNQKKIRELVKKFAHKYGVKVLSLANVGNHLHFHIRLGYRRTYPAFIRALTGSIAMAVTGASRWKPAKTKFWDYRPFTRIVQGYRAFLSLRDYIEVNQLEGLGYQRLQAQVIIERARWASSS